MNILRIQFCKISSKRLLYNTTLESCLEGNILRVQFCRIASKKMFWEYNSVELPQRESVGIQLRKVAPQECWVRMQFRKIASKRMLLDATSAEYSRNKYYCERQRNRLREVTAISPLWAPGRPPKCRSLMETNQIWYVWICVGV